MPNPWAIYDALVAGVPEGPVVADVVVGHWTGVRAKIPGAIADAIGIAMAHDCGPRAPADAWRLRGRPLREVAAYAMSWDLRLASVGVAALNAWYSRPERVDALPGLVRGATDGFFTHAAPRMAVRRTVVVGHFAAIDSLPGDVTVLERRPRGTDLPDSAAEYVLPGADLVVVTGSALVNKTLPRLLELARDAEVHLVGPSVVPAPDAYPPCVARLWGSVVEPGRAGDVWDAVSLGIHKPGTADGLRQYALDLHPGDA